MTRQKPRRQNPQQPRRCRNLPSTEQVLAWRAELRDRIACHNAIIAEKARRKGWIEQPDSHWFHPVHTPNGVTAPQSYSPLEDV